ncbi:DUF4252 domain-containing protein [Halpernia sp.]|uniref:DUF4252 domain-containing protein n=1 Tax=Halpernia sp. TaxID=2782209 RepID=UPI003A8D4412
MNLKFILKLTLFSVFFFLFQSCIVSSKPNIAYFKGAKSTNSKAEFTSVNLPLFLAKPMIKKALRSEGDKNAQEIIAIIKKISKVKILTVENGDETLVKNFASYLINNNYEDWVSIKHDGENVNIKAQQNGDFIKKLMLTVNSGNELVFIDIRGKFTPEDISNLINAANKN